MKVGVHCFITPFLCMSCDLTIIISIHLVHDFRHDPPPPFINKIWDVYLFIWGFTSLSTLQVLSRRVLGRAEETST